jgi:hypothetical protein
LEIDRLNGEGDAFALLPALALVRGGRPQGGVKGQILGFASRRAGLDVTAALAFGAGSRAASGLFPA